MKKILLFGLGKSSSALVNYLTVAAEEGKIHFTGIDFNVNEWQTATTSMLQMDIQNEVSRQQIIQSSDIVISLLPPSLHTLIANDCLNFSKHFLTASYLSDEILSMNNAAKEKGILFLMECGLDPGIDHMSALKEIEEIKSKGAEITSFKSYTGGLVAPESDDNPWKYKITWNPRNVVLAGQGTVKYKENGNYKYIPYHRLFSETETIHVENHGVFEGYANRDSLKYIQTYDLENTATFLRGTLRKQGFCSAWNLLVQLGLTEDTYIINDSKNLTWKEITLSYLKENKLKKTNQLLAALIHKGPGAQEISKLKWLGLLDDTKTGIPNATPAHLLQHKLEEKLMMKPEDKDMIVMQHIFEYEFENKKHRRTASLVLKGENKSTTAMAKTVGLPLGIAAMMLAEGKISLTGVHIPIHKEIYLPILDQLKLQGIDFKVLNYASNL